MEAGLSTDEAKIRLQKYGLNELRAKENRHILFILFDQFYNVLTGLLLVAVLLSFFVGEVVDAILILAIVILNACFGVYQERKAEAAIAALKRMTVLKVRVIRESHEEEIDSKYLVPGDILFIEEGMKIPADGKIIEETHISINESSLTGESLPVNKKKGDEIFSGTVVSTGRGKMEVTTTGMSTKFGSIAATLSTIQETKTPLQIKLASVSRIIGILGIAACVLVFMMSLAQGSAYLPSFLLAISLAVAVVPEGLPAILTITLSIGVSKMSKKKAIVRRLSAVETLGSITLIATDKTGTLTMNKMRVHEVFIGGTIWSSNQIKSAENKKLHLLLLNGVICSTASLVEKFENESEVLGDPTEGALLLMAKESGMSIETTRHEWKIVEEELFNSETKRMKMVAENGKEKIAFIKGAPESVLGICKELSNTEREKINNQIDRWAEHGYRVLGFATGSKDSYDFLGLVAIHDKPREEAFESIQKAQKAGIKVVMMTGDNPKTAEAVAVTLGLIKKGEAIIEGSVIDGYSDQELRQILPTVRVFSRMTPQQKYRVVKEFQALGEIVAVTGDGVNDAIALKQADVGIAMGQIGTDVARETADMVITDDNFATIVAAVEEGRNINKNLKNAIKYLLATNVSEAMALISGLFFGLNSLFIPLQFLYINLITDGIPAMAIAFSPHDEENMLHPPRKKTELISHKGLIYIISVGILGSIHVLISYYIFKNNEGIARTGAFTTLVLTQSFIFIDLWLSHKSLHRNLHKLRSGIFAIAFLMPFIIQGFIVHTPILSILFNSTPTSYVEYVTFAIISGSILLGVKIIKSIVKL